MKWFWKKEAEQIDMKNLPVHIGVIMDGNGRWAKKRGLPRKAGHRAGAENFEKIVDFCGNLGIRYLTFYAFSTENWKRPADEVEALMVLLEDYLDHGLEKIAGKNTRIFFIGDKTAFSEEFQRKIRHIEETTQNNDALQVNIALNYGGREEIAHACREIAEAVQGGKLLPESITEDTVAAHLYTKDIPDPDFIIRPSGEYRLSNFLMWQSAYAEFWYSNILWPDFGKEAMTKAICDYQKRNRRFGGV